MTIFVRDVSLLRCVVAEVSIGLLPAWAAAFRRPACPPETPPSTSGASATTLPLR